MGGNRALNRAAKAQEDEFYTQRGDIEKELAHYTDKFRGKVVYCNCDDPKESEFWQFFVRNFTAFGLKKLMATHYEPSDKNYVYKLEINGDGDGDGRVDENDVTQTPIQCNGDFRNQTSIYLLDEADIVVTNPPFSLFREYIAQLIEHGKQFLVIGNQNAIAYKDIFQLIMEDKIWLGYYAGDMAFKVPASYEPRKTRYWQDESGQKWRSLGNICWFTNINIPKRHVGLDLRGNYYDSAKYPKYDEYDAINVDRYAEIPSDFAGVMGVPITFLNHYNPEQFEIIGLDRYVSDNPHYGHRFKLDGKEKYARVLIRNRHTKKNNTLV